MRNEYVRYPVTRTLFSLRCGAMVAAVCVALAVALAPGAALARESTKEKEAKAQAAAAAQSAEAETQAASAPTGDEVGAPMACSALAAQKYPFLTCVRGISGGPVFATVGDGLAGQRLKIQDRFVKGDGHWGPSGLE